MGLPEKSAAPAAPSQRRLAAIMFTDLVGYSDISHRDENLAMALLAEHHVLVRGSLRRHGGVEIKTTGDGFLVEFSSVMQAIECARDILAVHHDRNAYLPAARQIHLRLGVHVGEIVGHEGDIYGDGVNIAARLQTAAPVDSIAFSRHVYDQVRNKLPPGVAVRELGRLALKNISTPIYGYSISVQSPREIARRVERMPLSPKRLNRVAAGVAVMLAAGASFWLLEQRGGPLSLLRPRQGAAQAARLEASRVAVLPFAFLSRDSDDDFLADGLLEDLVSQLSRMEGLKVVARTSVAKYKGSTRPVGEIARELRAGTLIEGSIRRRAGEGLRIAVRIIDGATEETRWSEEFDATTRGLFHIQSRIALEVGSRLNARAAGGEVSRRPAFVAPENPAAPENQAELFYLKGKYQASSRTRDGLSKAIELYRQAVEVESRFAPGYVGLAYAYELLGFYGHLAPEVAMKESALYARKALELDPTWGEAHLAWAENLAYYKHDWNAAEKEYKDATRLAPDSAQAHQWYGEFLVARGRFDEAQGELARANAAEPESVIIRSALGHPLYFAGDYAGAARAYAKAIEFDSSYGTGRYWLALADIAAGRAPEAVQILRKLVEGEGTRDPLSMLELARAYAAAGEVPSARKMVAEADRLRSGSAYVSSYHMAGALLALGDRKGALRELRRAVEEHSQYVIQLAVDPMFAKLRGEAGFEEILKRVGLK